MQDFQLHNIERGAQTLILQLQPVPDPQQDLAALVQWLCRRLPDARCQAEQNSDFCQIRFYFQQQPFLLTVEHYTASCWLAAGSRDAFLFLSQLAQALNPANSVDPISQGTSI